MGEEKRALNVLRKDVGRVFVRGHLLQGEVARPQPLLDP